MTIEAKQVYEWIKTGHWSLREFKDWLAEAEKHEVSQEPVAMQMDVIVVNLVREGINKHRARELAEHFIKHTHPYVPTERQPKRAVSETHKWVGLNWDDLPQIYVGDTAFMHGAKWAEAKLKAKNFA